MLDPPEPARTPSKRPFVWRVQIRNYKSIASCDVRLSALTVLVGRNGAGKSNFLDALRFVADSLQTSLDHALKQRGGIDAVRRRSAGRPRDFAVRLWMTLPDGREASYGFVLGPRERGGFIVKREELVLSLADARQAEFRIQRSDRGAGSHTPPSQAMLELGSGAPASSEPGFTASRENMPPPMADRLYLVTASGYPEFRPVYDGLLALGFYNFNPRAMRDPQTADAGELLRHDGSNIASVVARLQRDEPEAMERITEYLGRIVPSVCRVQQVAHGAWETLEFHQENQEQGSSLRFEALNVSDGTLRALGSLIAVMQRFERQSPVRLVGVEEPETALHPAALSTLMDALREAATHTQILLTCHSPDMLDRVDPEHATLLVVQADEGVTTIARVDPASRELMKEHLRTAGELLRLDQLAQDPLDLAEQRQVKLFEGDA